MRGCIDKDECKEGSHDCTTNAVCTNKPGFWKCSCPAGFTGLGYGNFTCEDNDECTDNTHSCKGIMECSNKVGSFGCKCPSGYKVLLNITFPTVDLSR